MIRAKFTVMNVQDNGYGEEVSLRAAYCNRTHETDEERATCESHSYSEATPDGQLRMLITNKAAQGQLQRGKSYFLDFTPAD